MKKRLMKKGEFFDSIQRNGVIYDIYKNPTDSEISNIKKSSSCGGVRGVILNDGTIYIWTEDLLHAQIGGVVNNNEFRFSWSYDMDEWYIDCHSKYSLQEALDIINLHKSDLGRIGDVGPNAIFSLTNMKGDKDQLVNGSEIFK